MSSALPYDSGEILTDTGDHVRKLTEAWRHIARRHAAGEALYNVSGLERGLPMPGDLDDWVLDDEWSGALFGERLRELGLAHLGGESGRDDVMVANRLTAALFAALQVTVVPGATVIGVSPSYSHPAVVRGVRDAGGVLVETVGAEACARALAAHPEVGVVVVTRLAVTYDALPEADLHRIVADAHAAGAVVVVDDAGGARVGPAVLGQPRTLEFGADLGATGLDKYGVAGPRVGLLGGRADLVAKARARAVELGSECRPVLYPSVVRCLDEYRPERVRELIASTRLVGDALRRRLGDWVEETPFITRLPGAGILAEIRRRAAGVPVDLAPIEATAAVAMSLLASEGLLTVHFAGLPPGTDALLIKFIPPETLAELGGAERFAEAIDDALDAVAAMASESGAYRALLHGAA
ncbi:L-seryl-tRNA(Ser) seleniumtransferase [Stackebrandtia albiflava]|uniref:L-seryl-tRNA(Ser) seleniumtransferase n=1 Tax=Stackebrandtia albiflava TaxID=406432 RepID=A0A562VCZ0_9ACTN|nr:hypothetical protein [Stackebrandtia albiflava]TWJ15732.1 L-seryl-tRNA(Ser) seleniumtransferase [Stackebrandtia albiflava]